MGAPSVASTMLQLGRAMVCSHRLPVQRTVVSGTVWPQFVMQVSTGGSEPPVWGRSSHRGWIWVP